MTTFKIDAGRFTLDGQEIRILSGSIHYFRVVPAYWRDRLEKLKACGLNTVETYVPWNLHEPRPGKYNFSGLADLVGFIRLAQELGLHVIVRPSPYICAEWEFGGLPAWLLADRNMRLRCAYRPYLLAIERYYDVLIAKLKPLQYTEGGPILAMQIENEYGSFGNDKAYLEILRQALLSRGVTVPLFTSDGPLDLMLQGGTLPDIFKTVNFGSRPQEAFAKLAEYQPDGPALCAEFWNGWFDHWGEQHHTREPEDMVAAFDQMLAAGASVNFYMFHGGTNFGFMNGANHADPHLNDANLSVLYQPTITSYDYDCLLSEDGEPTEKYRLVQDAIRRYCPIPEVGFSTPIRKMAYGEIALSEQAGLFENLPALAQPIHSAYEMSMEEVGQNYGFILYRTKVAGPRLQSKLEFMAMHDRAQVYVNGICQGTVYRNNPDQRLVLDFDQPVNQLDILVENMGRINFGPYLKDYKGLIEPLKLDYQFQSDWEIYPLPLETLADLKFTVHAPDLNDPAAIPAEQPSATAPGLAERPVFYRGRFDAASKGDTFLDLAGWTKGVAYINGFNLGRYWNIGPQKTLYIPAPLLKEEDNEIVIFELHACSRPVISLIDHPDLG